MTRARPLVPHGLAGRLSPPSPLGASRPRPPRVILVLALVLVLASLPGCGRSAQGEHRVLRVHGLPSCAGREYARPIVVRLDRDVSLFEERYSTKTMLTGPDAALASLEVPRQRMHATLRAGLCVATTLGTWDCSAPTWLAAASVTLDASGEPFDATLPRFEAACAESGAGRRVQ